MKFIDLRSDTVTHPTEEMRKLMYEAEVGDDVYGDDPTVNRLEALAAEMLGKEAAMFVPSGTMGNQLCIMTHTNRGDEIITGSLCHVFEDEVGAIAVLSGANVRTLIFPEEIPDPAMIKAAIRDINEIHYPHTGLISLENPTSTGRIVPLARMKEIYELAQANKLPIHIDGARLFNAAAALGVEASEITKYCDSVMVCVSKGLCAPIGSVIAGTKAFIGRARKNRKRIGGGMRQAGLMAAPAIYALEVMSKRLHIDHENAKYLAESLEKLDFVSIEPRKVDINMVFFRINRSQPELESFEKALKPKNVRINPGYGGNYRFVTHNGISRKDIDTVIEYIKELFA